MRAIRNIIIETKVTLWESHEHGDPLINSKEFLNNIKLLDIGLSSNEVSDALSIDDAYNSETLYDTIDEMKLSENKGDSTVEIKADLQNIDGTYNNTVIIWDNKYGVTKELKEWANAQIALKASKIKINL